LQEQPGGKRNHLVMGRTPASIAVHRLNLSEQRVLASFLAGRLPAGQVHAELARARTAPAVAPPTVAPQAEPAPAPVVQPVVVEPLPVIAA
jgi:hypothetical protein